MKYFLLIIISFTFICGFSQSHHPSIPFEHVAIPGTVNSSQVNDLVQDHHKLIWVAGAQLYRYDGYQFTSYSQLETGESIVNNEINCLISDSAANRLVMGTQSYGLVQYNYQSDKLSAIPCKDGIPIIQHISQTSDRILWASSYSNGLFYSENDTLKKVDDPKQRLTNITSSLAIGKKLLVNKLNTVYVLKNRVVIDSIIIQFPKFDFPSYTRVTCMTMDPQGRIWMGTERAGVLLYDTLKKEFIKHLSPETGPFYNYINKIMVDNKNSAWVLTKANGVIVYNLQTDQYITISKNPMIDRSLSGNNCTSIIRSQSGIIWIGSTGDLNKYDPAKLKFKHIYNNPLSPLSLSDNMVRSMYEDRDKKLWVGTDGGIINVVDPSNFQINRIHVKLNSNNQHIVPWYFLELNTNTILIGTSDGLLQYDRKRKSFSYYQPLKDSIGNKQVRQVLKQGDNLFLISGGTLVRYNISSGSFRKFNQFGDHPSLRNCTSIYFDSQNRLWVGAANGIALFDSVKETFLHIPFQGTNSRPASTQFPIMSIHEYNNKLWIGTYNLGLWYLDLDNISSPSLIRVGETGLPSTTIYATIPDDDGNLWISTNQGVSKYSVTKNQFTNFTTSDGLQHDEFNRLAYLRCSSGEIVFGGINGFNIFNPKRIVLPEASYEPKLIGVSVARKNSDETMYQELLQSTEVKTEYDQNDFHFHFYIPNYREPKRFDVFYKLSDYDATWTKAATNIIHYANLKPGEYQLEIKAVSHTGVEKKIMVAISIRPPFWETWWFLLICVSIVSFMVFTIIQSSIRKSRHDKKRLEKLLSERTTEIEKSREELANLNQKKDLIFSILSHDLRSPLTTLKGFLSILIDDSDHLSKEDIKRHASSIRNSVTSSLDLIDNTLFWSLSQTGNITYSPSVFSLDEMLRKIGSLYQLTADKKQIQFLVDVGDKVMVHGDENMIYVTLRNLVSNALKFTPEGKSVKISASKNGTFAEICIQDEGIGMSPSYMKKLMAEEQPPLKKGTSNEKGTGLGLILCKKFISINQGELKVNSKEGEGTEFILKLPLA